MAPRVRVTRQDILQAGLELVRTQGESALNVRNVAAAAGCSTQPVFSHFASMEQLRLALVTEAEAVCLTFVEQEIAAQKYPPYKASGMAYIRFAQQERNLFRLLYMRDRSAETGDAGESLWGIGTDLAQKATGEEDARAARIHMEMWALVHGFATMSATGYLTLDEETVSQMLTDVFRRLQNDQN